MKRSVNLLIKKKNFSPTADKIKRMTTIAAAVCIVFFLISFLATVLYVQSNIDSFNTVKKEFEDVEKKIALKKQSEGLYSLTSVRLNILQKILEKKSSYNGLINNVYKLPIDGIQVTGVNADDKGNLTLNIQASSSATLSDFVSLLLEAEDQKILSHISAQGILRRVEGNYQLTFSFIGNKVFYE